MRSLPRAARASSLRMRAISASGSGRLSSLATACLEPARAAEAPPHESARDGDDRQRRRIAPGELQLGHVLEVHAPYAGERGGDGEDAGPRGEPLRDLGLLDRHRREVDL